MENWKLPEYPDFGRLQEVQPEIKVLEPGRWHRVYLVGGRHPSKWNALRYFGPIDARFDHHDMGEDGGPYVQSRGVFYCARTVATCLAEFFQLNRAIDPNIGKPWLVSFDFVRVLKLLDLTGGFPVRVGASQAINTGFRKIARNWSRGFYDIYPEIEGLYFRTSMTGDIAIVLYECALLETPFDKSPKFHRPLNDPMLSVPLQQACIDIGYRALW